MFTAALYGGSYLYAAVIKIQILLKSKINNITILGSEKYNL